MKKLLVLVVVLIGLFLTNSVFAAGWSVTVTWGRSVGPNLDREEVFYDGKVQCTILPQDNTTCNFVIPALTGEVWVRSYNEQGAYAETSHVPIQPEVAPATGVSVTVTYVP